MEDEVVLSTLLREFLEANGYNVLTAVHGKMAVELYSLYYEKITCIIMDIVMPVMDGYSAMLEIQKINPEAKVIITSGFSGDEKREDPAVSGALAYIKKPYQMHVLLKTMRAVIEEDRRSILA
ncbi:MAG: response regulator [Okeania sp. SIO3B3]|nr:response regulator [Okeania sp. SIO3B3]